MGTMYDSTDPFAIPSNAQIVAGNGDGQFAWPQAGWDRFPSARKLVIVCFASSAGDILDIQQGCSSPFEVPGWLDRYSRPLNPIPTLYVNLGNWDAVRQQVGARQVDYWVATLNGTTQVLGAAAVQYQDVGPYDISLTRDWWPRTAVSPGPQPQPWGPFLVVEQQ